MPWSCKISCWWRCSELRSRKAEFGTKHLRNKISTVVALENVYMGKARKEMDILEKVK